MKSALLISYWFPPASNQTWRSYHIYRELKRHFISVKVLSTANRKHLPEQDYQGSSADVITAATLDYRTFFYFKKRKRSHVSEQKKGRLGFWVYHLLNSFPFNLLTGEGGLLYIIDGYFKAKNLVRSEKTEIVFSTFRPYSDHFIAYLLKRKFPHLAWVADFRDLHLDPALEETFFPAFQKWCNRKILAKANVVTTVSKGLAEHLIPFHPNVKVLRNGIGTTHQSPVTHHQSPVTKFTIAYTGSMFRNLRKPDLLLEALTRLFQEKSLDSSKVQIVYAGKDEGIWLPLVKRYNLTSNFNALGNIPHEEARLLQANTHINLLLTYATPELKGNATGKLYEYLAARQSVLLLVNGCRDEELEEIFEETGAGLIAYDGLEGTTRIEGFLKKHYDEWLETGTVSPAISPASLENYRWENMMREFLYKNTISLRPVSTLSANRS
jgi:hypothetical protein